MHTAMDTVRRGRSTLTTMSTSNKQVSETIAGWPLWQCLGAFVAAVLGVHAVVVTFHLLMLPEWPVGRTLRALYYHRHGVKETWPLIDYYVPILLLVCVTVGFLRRRSIWIHLTGWILCCVTVVGMTPIYSTRLVPTPVSTWGTPRPPPFQRLPERFPTLLAASIFSIIARYSMNAETGGNR